MAVTGVMLLSDGARPGLIDSLSPAWMFGGGLGLAVLGIIALVLSSWTKSTDGSDALTSVGWIMVILGIAGFLIGLFGLDG